MGKVRVWILGGLAYAPEGIRNKMEIIRKACIKDLMKIIGKERLGRN